MNAEINYTLLADGSSDEVLIPIISWVLRQHFPDVLIQAVFANLSRLKVPPKALEDRIKRATEYYPCDVLFVHRDAENANYEERRKEIQEAWSNIKNR